MRYEYCDGDEIQPPRIMAVRGQSGTPSVRTFHPDIRGPHGPNPVTQGAPSSLVAGNTLNRGRVMGGIMLAWLAEMGIQTFKSTDRVVGLPVPSIYLADMLLFGVLAFGAKESSQVKTPATLFAWGVVLLTLLNNPAAPAALSAKLAGSTVGTFNATNPANPTGLQATNQAPGTTTAGGRG